MLCSYANSDGFTLRFVTRTPVALRKLRLQLFLLLVPPRVQLHAMVVPLRLFIYVDMIGLQCIIYILIKLVDHTSSGEYVEKTVVCRWLCDVLRFEAVECWEHCLCLPHLVAY